ncbi:hypothetical protein ACOIP5_005325 [Salmonella enterica]|nr:hypothetical protein [Salmonella enterica subsp. houtenae]
MRRGMLSPADTTHRKDIPTVFLR